MRVQRIDRWVVTRLLVMILLLVVAGCDIQSGSPATTGQAETTAPTGPTIVSLTPAVTQMLIDMGKRDQLVGVSADDDKTLGLPTCGTFRDPVIAQLIALDPDLVITESAQGDPAGVPAMLRELADKGVYDLAVIPHSRSIADIERALTDARVGLGQAVDDTDAAERTRELMAMRLDLVATAVKDADRPRVLMLINPATLGAIGTDVTHAELLALAGGDNAAERINAGYITLSRAQVQRDIRPDVILIFEPNGSPIRDNDPRLRALEGLDLPALTNRRVAVIRHPQAMLPSTSLPGVLVEMACAIHPDRAETIRSTYALAEQVIESAAAAEGAGR